MICKELTNKSCCNYALENVVVPCKHPLCSSIHYTQHLNDCHWPENTSLLAVVLLLSCQLQTQENCL